MATLLHVFAHPAPEASYTLRIANAFLDGYREAHPGDAVEEIDLYAARMHPLTAAHTEAIEAAGHPERMSPEAAAVWEEIHATVTRFIAADKLLVTAPMWNFTVPSILLSYIEHVVLAGYTFRFTGPGASEGLMTGRPLAIVSTRGGIYSRPPMSRYEMCVNYLRHVFEFIGFEIRAELVAEGLALVAPHAREEILAPVIAEARDAGRTFDLPSPMRRAA